jgi:hypothetical protein
MSRPVMLRRCAAASRALTFSGVLVDAGCEPLDAGDRKGGVVGLELATGVGDDDRANEAEEPFLETLDVPSMTSRTRSPGSMWIGCPEPGSPTATTSSGCGSLIGGCTHDQTSDSSQFLR